MDGFRRRLHRARDWLRCSVDMKSGPSTVLIEVTSECNLNCPECRRKELVEVSAQMHSDLFKRVMEQCVDCIDMAYLFGWGEPFLWSHMASGLALARRLGIKTNITTNAAYPVTDSIRHALSYGPDLLILAIDSHLADVYEKYRYPASFSETVDTARQLITATTRDTTVVMQMIRWPEMQECEAEYRQFAHSLGSVDVAARRSYDRTSCYNADQSDYHRPCPVLWHGPAYVRCDGTVFPCCVMTDYPLGNMGETTLIDCWNSSIMQQLREWHRTGNIARLHTCRQCYHSRAASYPALYALAGCFSNGPMARRWMFRLDRWYHRLHPDGV